MSSLMQIVRVTLMNLLSMRLRLGASVMIVIGMAAVVGVALSVFSMAEGLQGLGRQGADSGRMIVMSEGAPNDYGSSIPYEKLGLILDAPGIKKGADGKPLASPQVSTNFATKRRVARTRTFGTVYGLDQNLTELWPNLKLVEGRMFMPGRREVIAGRASMDKFDGISLGASLIFQDGPWEVVGIYDSPDAFKYLLMTDAETLRSALRRGNFNVVRVRLDDDSKAGQERFQAALKANPALSVAAETEETFYARQLSNPTRFYAFLAFGVGGIMGLGAIFAGLNTMYASVAARRLEIATLRAIGFGPAPVAISVIIESLTLAAIGAIAGTIIAWVAFNGQSRDFGSFDVIMTVTPGMVGAGLAFAAAIGLVGAIFPALRAARLPVATALQVR